MLRCTPGITTNHPVSTHLSKDHNINQYFTLKALYIFTRIQQDNSQPPGTRAIRPKSASKRH
ncbi:hypothetical protein MES5069_20063 [Mesorhizobium escarrei]|uniref:Uncharacterized protein n=1 Tax=Mesorhizobium escarrei TaxID=666018 RepID=A0ABN8JKZ3_9HYPH|nr:hypothetical protein MES5069_20063 [Mesorhizobium escarrei]